MSLRRRSLSSPAPLASARPEFARRVRRSMLGRAGIVALAALSLALWGAPDLTRAQMSEGSDYAEALTQALINMSAQYGKAAPAERSRLESSLVAAAATRLQFLTLLIEANPGALLRAALPAAVHSSLPSVVTGYLEQDVEREGTLEILHEDWPGGGRYSYFLHSTSGRYSLHFADRQPEHLLTGALIRVRGVQIGTALALGGSGATVKQLAPAPLPNAFGEQRTLVILVNFQDNPIEPYTVAYAQGVVFGTTSDFFLENSYQHTWLGGDVVGWYTVPLDSTTCDMGSLEQYAESAATAAGVDLSAYAHRVYAFPQNYACYFWGRSTVGGNPSRADINGDFELEVLAHELGHGLGLWHSHSMECGPVVLGPSCVAYEYGNTLDVMGAASSGHFNAFQKERLGWLNGAATPPITTVLADGTYRLEAYELAGVGPKALKIPKATDPNTGVPIWHYVESRQAIGFDALLTNVIPGVVVHFGTESHGNSSYLLDMTPESGSSIYLDWRDPGLAVGQRFSDPDAGVTMTTEWVTATEAAVAVRFQAVVTVSTDQLSYTRNESVSIQAAMRFGGSPIANAAVTFTVTKSTGEVVTGTVTTGSNGTAVYKLRLRRRDPVGIYQVSVVATKSGLSGSATTSFTVQ